MSEEKKDLLPCPFCGSSAMLEELGDHHGAYHNLGCSKRECPAHHAIYTESEAPVEDSVNWWNTRAALQESEAGAVLYMAKNLHSKSYATSSSKAEAELFLLQSGLKIDGKEAAVIPLYLAPQSAQAIETAAIMRIVELEAEIVRLNGGYYEPKPIQDRLADCRNQARQEMEELCDRITASTAYQSVDCYKMAYAIKAELRRMAESDKTTMEGEKE